MNKYEQVYKLHTQKGVKTLIADYSKLAELRLTTGNFELCDFLIDFDIACKKCLTDRQYEVISYLCKYDFTLEKLTQHMGLTMWTIHEHVQKATNKIAKYHEKVLEKEKALGYEY